MSSNLQTTVLWEVLTEKSKDSNEKKSLGKFYGTIEHLSIMLSAYCEKTLYFKLIPGESNVDLTKMPNIKESVYIQVVGANQKPIITSEYIEYLKNECNMQVTPDKNGIKLTFSQESIDKFQLNLILNKLTDKEKELLKTHFNQEN